MDSHKLILRFGLWIESLGPLAISAITIAVLYYFAPAISQRLAEKAWHTSDLYTAVFNWSAIQTGFAFGVYGFVVGRSEGFIPAIRDTTAMRRFLGYVQRANIGGFLLTIASLPLTIVNPSPEKIGSISFYVVLVWFGLFVWTFLAFLRIAFNFGRLSGVKTEPVFYGA